MRRIKRELKEIGLLHAVVIGLVFGAFAIVAVPDVIGSVSFSAVSTPDFSGPFEGYSR